MRSRTKVGLLFLLLLVQLAISAVTIQSVSAADAYTSLTYDGQITFTFDAPFTSTSKLVGTAQITFTVTLDQSSSLYGAGNIQGSTGAQGTFSGTFTDSDPFPHCASTYQVTATYTTTMNGLTSFQDSTVHLRGGSVSNYVETDSPAIPPGYGCTTGGASGDISEILIDCTFHSSQTQRTNGGCDKFPIPGGSQTIAKGPSNDFNSISGTAELTLVSSTSSTTSSGKTSSTSSTTSSGKTSSTATTSSSSFTITSNSTTTSASAGCDPLPNIGDFGVRLAGVRRGSTEYANTVSEMDTLFFDGVFSQPAPPFSCPLSVDVYVTVTGSDEVPVNYRTSVEASIAGRRSDAPPETWLTISPGPISRPIGLWEAVPTAVIRASDVQGRYDIGTIHGDSLPFLVTSATPAMVLNMSAGNIPVYGNLSVITINTPSLTNQNGVPTLRFNATGPPGTQGHMTLVVPKTIVPGGMTPAVFVNGRRVELAGTPIVQQCLPLCPVGAFMQDDNSYTIRITMHFSTNLVEIQFQTSAPLNPDGWIYPAVELLVVIALTSMIAFVAYSRVRSRSRGRRAQLGP